jgi:hypothetical protein
MTESEKKALLRKAAELRRDSEALRAFVRAKRAETEKTQ